MSEVYESALTVTPYSIQQMTGLRVVQCADIWQRDRHGGQIRCNQTHAVLIDFSATTQTVDFDVDLSKDD